MNTPQLLLICLAVFAFSCNDPASTKSSSSTTVTADVVPDPNPAAEGFNATASDARAIEIADSVVMAHGGRRAYDQTRYFKWNFFGVRSLTWDKLNQRVRIDFPAKQAVYLLNYADMSGRAMVAGEEITQPDSLAKALNEAKSIWINDSYWLVHQFKLKDSGVTLKYVDDTPVDPEAARPSYIIDQTFSEVGDTPGNRYRLYVDKENFRINTWQFFKNAADTEPAMQTPWLGYKTLNGLQISTDRSGRFQLQDVATPGEVDELVFSAF